MDLEYILSELDPLDYYKEPKCLTLIFNNQITIFLRDWEDDEIMWHVFMNKEHVDAGVDEEIKLIRLFKNYIQNNTDEFI